jgi:hypothetical protein
MIPVGQADAYQRCIFPWIYDHIEVSGSRFTGPPTGQHLQGDFDRPREHVAFCLLGTFQCRYESGPALSALADVAAEVLGENGFYGLKSARRLNP